MRKVKNVLLILLMIFSLAACGEKNIQESETTSDEAVSETESNQDSKEGYKVFGDFSTKTLEGEEVTQDIFKEADLTMVNIWGTFCSPCINEMPDLGEISREYEEKGFRIVGMLCDVTEPGDETALDIIEETGADYMHVVASEDLVNGILQYVSSVPTTIFVDKDGNMVGDPQMGSRDKESWEIVINNYLTGVQ